MDIQNFADTFSPEMRKNIWKIVTTPLTDEQREKFRGEMAKKGFITPNKEYDQHGLRFDIHYLNRIAGAICMMPLEFMADYVDGVCKSSMDRDDGLMEEDVLTDDMTEESFKDTNATGLGNMAYMILHTKDEQVKAKCLDCLWRYMNYYIENLIAMVTKQMGSQPVN